MNMKVCVSNCDGQHGKQNGFKTFLLLHIQTCFLIYFGVSFFSLFVMSEFHYKMTSCLKILMLFFKGFQSKQGTYWLIHAN